MRRTILSLIVLSFFVFNGTTIFSQPVLNLKSLQVGWPRVAMRFDVRCNGQLRFDLTKHNIFLKEDSRVISDYILATPDTNQHCCMSVALVIDRTASMQLGNPSRLDSAKSVARSFVNLMRPSCDSAALVSFGNSSHIDVRLTNDTANLIRSIDALMPGGESIAVQALKDAVYHIGQSSSHYCRAIILLTDSTHDYNTPDFDPVTLARIYNIRIYPIALGVNCDSAQMQYIADETGGKFYRASVSGSMADIVSDIYNDIENQFYECLLTYTSWCPDGTRRNVFFSIQNFPECPGTDVRVQSFKAPRDTTQFTPLTIKLGEAAPKGGGPTFIPLVLETPISDSLHQATFKILFDETCV